MLQPSSDYTTARERLRQAEIALKDQREQVAALRRGLPQGPALPAYTLQDENGPVTLSNLFRSGCTNLAVIHFMYRDEDRAPCPMCSMWADGYNAVVTHIEQHMPVVLVAKATPAKLQAHADSRGWNGLRLLSSAGTSFNRDFGMETEDGSQVPGFSVLQRDAGGTVRQFYTGCAMMGGGHYRGLDMLSPVWNILDLTPEGRGEWFPGLRYD